MLLIAGRPGSGRTSLAVHLAHELADRHPDGRVFARLSHCPGEPVPTEQAARELLRGLGAPVPAADAPGAVAAGLRRALRERRALLVLDDAVDSEQVLPLLPDAPGCLVVVTARGPLTGVADVRPCVLGGLDADAAVRVLAEIAGATRVTCDPIAAESLVEECAGHPAALRLAAGWLAARPGTSVADAVRRLREADRAGATALARAFRLAHDSLPPVASRMLRLLALAPTGLVDAHTASALAGCPPRAAGAVLRDLAGQGLLLPEPLRGEYRVPGCLRGMLRELLETKERAGEIQLARARMLERTVRLLGACRAVLGDGLSLADGPAVWPVPPRPRQPAAAGGPAGPGARQPVEVPRELRFASAWAAAEWLRARLPGLLAAARTATANGDLDNLARRVIVALVRLLSLPEVQAGGGGAAAELYQLHGLLLEVARRGRLHREEAAAAIDLADLDAAAGRSAEALDRYRGAVRAARAGGDEAAAGRALESIGETYRDLGDPQRAVDWYLRALAVRESRGELTDQARLHGLLGDSHVRMQRWAEAVRAWRAAASLYRRAGDSPACVRALAEVARVLEHAGQAEDSLRTSREALRWARDLDDARLEAAVLLRMAETLERLGDATGARMQREEAERLLAG